MTLSVFIGYDAREDIAWQVCAHSILSRTNPAQINIVKLEQQDLRNRKLYWREVDLLAATDFSLTRFLTPYLAGFKGFAIFVDCDFLFLTDIQSVLSEIDTTKAVSVVQHNYRPVETIKMDQRKQLLYPRKNWSSFMVFNCEHPANQKLTPEAVNSAAPLYLHGLEWLQDDEIGSVDKGWNYLEGWYPNTYDQLKAVHYTRGGPWFEHMRHCDFANLWLDEKNKLQQS